MGFHKWSEIKHTSREPHVPVIKNGQVIDQRVVFVVADGWTATYIDGRKELDGHSVSVHSLLKKLGIEFTHLQIDQKWFEEEAGCDFPDKLQDVELEKE